MKGEEEEDEEEDEEEEERAAHAIAAAAQTEIMQKHEALTVPPEALSASVAAASTALSPLRTWKEARKICW
jgi:CO dehydrogenase/acetyl-CoA synthase beta subunit